jgi:hypothetical protein
MFHTDGRTDGQTTDMTKLIVALRNFANAPNKHKILGRLIVTSSIQRTEIQILHKGDIA